LGGINGLVILAVWQVIMAPKWLLQLYQQGRDAFPSSDPPPRNLLEVCRREAMAVGMHDGYITYWALILNDQADSLSREDKKAIVDLMRAHDRSIINIHLWATRQKLRFCKKGLRYHELPEDM